jgi:NADPH:quinone reductase-like Zn-dependent oxidoreductase
MKTPRHITGGPDASDLAMSDSTMQAIVRDRYGSADVLRLARIARPEAGELDRGAWHLMTGRPYAIRLGTGLRAPRHPGLGREVSGTVAAVGTAVTGFAVGDEVYGIGQGSFAEYAVARADKLAPKPANVTFEQAAVVPVSGLTALQALRDAGRLQPGQHVLIIGASGGVGSFAVQLAKALGAQVTGVCSTTKLDLVRSLGADEVLDYTQDDWADGAHRYDLILDIAGNPTPSRLRRALNPAGTAVIVGGEGRGSLTGGMDRQLRALALSMVVRQRFTGLLCKENSTDLQQLTQLIEAGKVTPSVDRSYPLAEVPEAVRHLDTGRARGKVAITVNE